MANTVCTVRTPQINNQICINLNDSENHHAQENFYKLSFRQGRATNDILDTTQESSGSHGSKTERLN